MENQNRPENVPYIVHESSLARMERINRRLWIALILVICLFVATNAGWIWHESQWEVVETTVTQTNEGSANNYIGNDGDIYNGTEKVIAPEGNTNNNNAKP